eukprot:1087647-Amphidinium_carterae.1
MCQTQLLQYRASFDWPIQGEEGKGESMGSRSRTWLLPSCQTDLAYAFIHGLQGISGLGWPCDRLRIT